MESFHQMLPEDEVFMCGVVTLLGIVVGVLARLVVGLRERSHA